MEWMELAQEMVHCCCLAKYVMNPEQVNFWSVLTVEGFCWMDPVTVRGVLAGTNNMH
jgi:hypothetical protein